MSFAVLMGLFLLKHGLLAHVVDFGYSLSRSPKKRHWFLGLYSHAVAEAAGSVFLLSHFTWSEAAIALSLEHIAIVLSSLVERRAPLRKLLQVHIYCEVGVMLVYLTIVMLLAMWD